MSSPVAEQPDTTLTSVYQSTEDDYFPGTASSGWLDDLCMEPITPVPGFSKLCNACIKVFRGDIPWRPDDTEQTLYVRHIRCFEVLKISAQRGCRLCALLLTSIQNRASCPQVTMTSVIGLHFSKLVGRFYSRLSFWGIGLSSWHFPLSLYPTEGQSIPAISSVLWLIPIVPHRPIRQLSSFSHG